MLEKIFSLNLKSIIIAGYVSFFAMISICAAEQKIIYNGLKFSEMVGGFKPELNKGCEILTDDDKNESLKVELKENDPKNAWYFCNFDVKKFDGKTIFFSVDIDVENIKAGSGAYDGVKFQVYYKTNNVKKWQESQTKKNDIKAGTLAFSLTIPNDVESVRFSIGLQNSRGKVVYKNFRYAVYERKYSFTLPDNFKAEYTDDIASGAIMRGAMVNGNFDIKDIAVLAYWNANLARFQLNRKWNGIGVNKDIDEFMAWVAVKIKEIKLLSPELEKLGIKVVVDMHTPVGGRMDSKEMLMFHDEKYGKAFVEMWKYIAKELKDIKCVWAYDLINEPINAIPAQYVDYLELQYMAAKAIREIDGHTPIIIESAEWDSPNAFVYLKPLPLKNIIYQAHMYYPGTFTHQQVHDKNGRKCAYLSVIGGVFCDKSDLKKHLQPVMDFQKKYGARIYIGEFGAVRWGENSHKYLADCIEIFEENSWDWSYHAFREWQGWSVELGTDKDDLSIPEKMPERKKVILESFKKNIK